MSAKTFRHFYEKSQTFVYITVGQIMSDEGIKIYESICIDGGKWEQSTGLKDKNGEGNEVYGGDLFEVVYSNVPNGFTAMSFKKEVKINIGEVVFKSGGFKMKSFHPDHQEDVYMDLHTFLKNDEKVIIGNVFQNKELLES